MIFATPLLSLLTLVLAGDTARFHPANADVYFEVPDVRAAVAAYGAAPLVKTLGDPAVEKIADAAKLMGVDLKAAVGGMMPTPDPNRPDDRFWPWSALTSMSLSVAGVDAPAGDTTSWSDRASGWIVLDFADADAAAQALVALGASAGVTRVSTQRSTAVNESTEAGADGWVVDEGQRVPPKPDPAPKAAPKQDAGAAVARAETVNIDGNDAPIVRHELALGDVRFPIWLVRVQSRIVGGLGRAQPAELVARLAKPESGFGAMHATLVKEEGLPAATGVRIARAWSDLEKLGIPGMDTGDAAAARVAEMFGAESLPFVGRRGGYRLQLVGDRFVWESLTERIGSGRMLEAFYAPGQVPASTARFVPKEAVGAWLFKFRPEELDTALMGLLGQGAASATTNDPSAKPTDPAAKPNDPSAKPTDTAQPKLSSGMGDSAAMFLMPLGMANMSGGNVMPNVTVVLELKDAKAFQTALDAWIAHVKARDPALSVENKPYHKHPVYTFSRAESGGAASGDEAFENAGGGDESGLHPVIAILPDRILIAPSRKYVQSEVRRGESAKVESHVLAGEGVIPKDAFEVSWIDWGGLVGKLYDLGRGVLPMMAQGTPGFDASKLPTAEELFRHIQPSTSYSTRVGGKQYTYSASSLGPETPLALAGLAFAISEYGQKTAREIASSAVILPGATESGVIDVGHVVKVGDEFVTDDKDVTSGAQRTATMSALRDVKTGLAVYRSQFGRVPDTLDELLKGTDAFPSGFLDGGAVPKDGWNKALVYSAQEKGARYTLRSCGPDGIDDKGSGDDVTAP